MRSCDDCDPQAPAILDAATTARFTLVDGERDRNGGSLDVLHDGRVPTGEDQPSANFFFAAGMDGGRLAIDLGKVIAVKRVGSYSWHPDNRAPQVYQLYAADGNALLFDISRTADQDPFANTFFNEIDVIDADGPEAIAVTTGAAEPIPRTFDAEAGKYRFTIDATTAPDLADWADAELRPVVQAWYPKLVAMLPSDGFFAPTNLTLRFRNDMGGTPASAGGGRINMNSD